jgi:hypothetical protein
MTSHSSPLIPTCSPVVLAAIFLCKQKMGEVGDFFEESEFIQDLVVDDIASH